MPSGIFIFRKRKLRLIAPPSASNCFSRCCCGRPMLCRTPAETSMVPAKPRTIKGEMVEALRKATRRARTPSPARKAPMRSSLLMKAGGVSDIE